MAAAYPVNQTNTTSVVLPPQAQIMMQPQPQQISTSANSKTKALRGIAIAEVVLGSLCVVLGAVFSGYVSDHGYRSSYGYGYYRAWTTGEGIWCGVWIVIAGGLGIAAGSKRATPCIINCHMGFAVTGAVFSITLFGLGIGMVSGTRTYFAIGLMVVNIVAAFLSFILLIVSASLTCCINPQGCCGGCCGECCGQGYLETSQQVAYIGTAPGTAGQPAFVQTPAPGTIPQYTMPVVMQQGPVIPSNSAATTSQVMPTDQLGSDAGQRKQQEASNVTQSPTESGQGYPPAYSQ
ncbi:uncharacterized protein LOC143460248 isoform X2 [Clavelina lepadiformis]|uniref:uncharacterized protein LOC143460248 isoform X2 n=1 Tax=Clavelina lepadiformis TaxID=159417 RepID=UPI0040417E65